MLRSKEAHLDTKLGGPIRTAIAAFALVAISLAAGPRWADPVAAVGSVAINEVESNGGSPGGWVRAPSSGW